MNATPALQVFIASASEGLELANILRDCLTKAGFEARVWNESTFQLSQSFIEALEGELKQVDFAVLTLTPDDRIKSRGKTQMAPRDNVVFELGLFMGRLGRDRAYFVFDKAYSPKLPSDLLGVIPAAYERNNKKTSLAKAVGDICAQMSSTMRQRGPRTKMTSEEEAERDGLTRFCQRTVGLWYQRMLSPDEVSVSLIQMTSGIGLHTINMDGEAFSANGHRIARWRSTTTGMRVSDRTLFYSWDGDHPTALPGIRFSGFGRYEFKKSDDIFTEGTGFFADIQAGKDVVLWKSIELRRVEKQNIKRFQRILQQGSDAEKAILVKEIIAASEQGYTASAATTN